ncbi:MAG TPA: hypothetical protein VGH37_19605 [Candidatus Acidoferrum sp.]|jgi:hypothetical protein
MRVFTASRPGLFGAGVYLIAFISAAVYPLFSRDTFSGLAAVMLAWPWIDFLPLRSAKFMLVLFAVLNAAIIYIFVSVVSSFLGRLLRRT